MMFNFSVFESLLHFVFMEDYLMIPVDPFGKRGPHLDELLSVKQIDTNSKEGENNKKQKKKRPKKRNKQSDASQKNE
jgi:hypothetical protein